MDASIRRTKGEIEKEILENEKLRMSEEYMDDPVGQKQFDLINAELKKQYLTAPESSDPVQVDGSFYSIPVVDPMNKLVGSYMGIEARSENGILGWRTTTDLQSQSSMNTMAAGRGWVQAHWHSCITMPLHTWKRKAFGGAPQDS